MTTNYGVRADEIWITLPQGRVNMLRGGTGRPLVVLHRDTGRPGWGEFEDALAAHHAVYAPALPGFLPSERPAWMRSITEMAVIINALLRELGIAPCPVVGLGFGGWVAAEMAVHCDDRISALVLQAPMGVKPPQGEIVDQFLIDEAKYVALGFHDASRFVALYGEQQDDELLRRWDLAREMTTRIAWKPYMYNPALPHLLPLVRTPTLLLWGDSDAVVPFSCAEVYRSGLPHAELATIQDAGHQIDLERPADLAQHVLQFLAGSAG